VAPKKLKLAEAESELSVQMGKLNAKRAELQEVRNKLTTESKIINDNYLSYAYIYMCVSLLGIG